MMTESTGDIIREEIAWLREFMLPERFSNMERAVSFRTDYMSMLLENTFYSQNASALIRTSEAFGIQDVHAVESQCGFVPNTNIVRGTDKWVDIHRYSTTEEAVSALRASGFRIVVTSPHLGGSTPETFDVGAGRFCLVFGTEKHGVSQQAIAMADEFITIPMCGFVESLNLSASAAILLHTLSVRMRESVQAWTLPPDRRDRTLLAWMRLSVNDADSILRNRFGDRTVL